MAVIAPRHLVASLHLGSLRVRSPPRWCDRSIPSRITNRRHRELRNAGPTTSAMSRAATRSSLPVSRLPVPQYLDLGCEAVEAPVQRNLRLAWQDLALNTSAPTSTCITRAGNAYILSAVGPGVVLEQLALAFQGQVHGDKNRRWDFGRLRGPLVGDGAACGEARTDDAEPANYLPARSGCRSATPSWPARPPHEAARHDRRACRPRERGQGSWRASDSSALR